MNKKTQKNILKRITLLSILTLSLYSCSKKQNTNDISHIQEDQPFHNESVSTQRMTDWLIKDAEKYSNELPDVSDIIRYAKFDAAFPSSYDEFKAVNGFGILVVSSVSKNPEELPVKRVYYKHSEKELEYTYELLYEHEVPVTDTLLMQTFGKHRYDSYYLAPCPMVLYEGNILIDWKTNRKGFQLAKTPFTEFIDFDITSDEINEFSKKGTFDAEAFKAFIKREFPLPDDAIDSMISSMMN